MRTLIIFAALVSAVSIPETAEAKLAESLFSDLLVESDLVLLGTTTNVELAEGRYPKSATVAVEKVYKGSFQEKTITLNFSSEVHDQAIREKDGKRLLFLKKNAKGEYEGAHYGRSYWPLFEAKAPKAGLATPYIYPTTMVKIDYPSLLEKVDFRDSVRNPNESWEGKTKEGIYLDSLVAVLEKENTPSAIEHARDQHISIQVSRKKNPVSSLEIKLISGDPVGQCSRDGSTGHSDSKGKLELVRQKPSQRTMFSSDTLCIREDGKWKAIWAESYMLATRQIDITCDLSSQSHTKPYGYVIGPCQMKKPF